MLSDVNSQPFSAEQLSTTERIIPEKIAEIQNDVEKRRR